MNKVDKAIIMAAGQGTRLRPITLTTPKPLVKVNGKAMIETAIEALKENGIHEIYIVVGYLKEQFQYLKEKYDGITILENNLYDKYNNIYSLYVARDYIENAIILDGDQIIFHKEILAPEFEKSGYNCVWVEESTKDWLLQVENGSVTSCSRTGGNKGWQLYSVSRWTKEDGKRLKKHLEIEFDEKKNTDIFWDDVALFCYPKEYDLGIFEMKKDDIIEIDTVNELIALDASYQNLGKDLDR